MAGIDNAFIKCLNQMSDKQIIEYAEAYLGIEGRELVFELTHRIRLKKTEIYELSGKLENMAERHTLTTGEKP